MTAEIVGVLVAQGLLDLDRPIAEYGVTPRCAGSASGKVGETSSRSMLLCTAHLSPLIYRAWAGFIGALCIGACQSVPVARRVPRSLE